MKISFADNRIKRQWSGKRNVSTTDFKLKIMQKVHKCRRPEVCISHRKIAGGNTYLSVYKVVNFLFDIAEFSHEN